MMVMKLRFGGNELDLAARQLRHGGRDVHLSTKAFDLLALLAERRPAAVPKREIRDELWPDTFVSDSNLPTLIAEIRVALGDDARHGQFVRTVHGFGYAFSAETFEVDAQTAAADPGIADGAVGRLVSATARIAIGRGEHRLGREGPAAVALYSSTVSRRHARLVVSGEGATLEDLGSKNGTYVNEARVTMPIAVHDGDRVRVGSLMFTVRFARA